MCFTPEDSIYAFLTNLVSSIILLNYVNKSSQNYKDVRIIVYFLIYLGIMQLYDYIFWLNSNNNINYVMGKIAMLTNFLQPTVLFLLIKYYKGNVDDDGTILSIIYTICALLYAIYIWNNIGYTIVTNRTRPSLDWEWNNQKYNTTLILLYLLTLSVLLFKNFSKNINKFFVFIGLFSYIISFYKYNFIKSAGRMWCYSANFIPLMIFIYLYFTNKN